MFNQGGRPSSERRREVDLYFYCDDVDELHGRLKDRVEIYKVLSSLRDEAAIGRSPPERQARKL